MKNIYVLSATFDSFSAKNRTPRPWALTSQPDLRPGLDPREHSPPSLICALAWTHVNTHLSAWSAPWPGPPWILTSQPDLRPGLDPREYSPPAWSAPWPGPPVSTHLPAWSAPWPGPPCWPGSQSTGTSRSYPAQCWRSRWRGIES